MLWVFLSLVYGIFTAIYMLFNQHYKINGYILGIWRGFGICALFLPLLFVVAIPNQPHYWILLAIQGVCIGVYDSNIFFNSARFGAGPTSRFMAVTVLLTAFIWWLLTPQKFFGLLQNGKIMSVLMFILCGFTFFYWQMLQNEVSRQVAKATMPAVLALAAMSIITKYIAESGNSVYQGLFYYLTVSTFISGIYNLLLYLWQNRKLKATALRQIIAPKMHRIGAYLITFSSVLIAAKTLALRLAPNPAYVIALLLIAPLFIYLFNRNQKIADNISVKAGFAMIAFLLALIILVTGNFGITD